MKVLFSTKAQMGVQTVTLEGPAKIEVSDEQLEALTSTYSDLASEMETMINDFFKPFEIMSKTWKSEKLNKLQLNSTLNCM